MQNINHKAPVSCTKSIVISSPASEVWKVLTDINRWPEWQREISKATVNGPLESGTTFDWKTGGMAIHSTLHTVQPFTHFGWTGKVMGIYAIHNFTLKPQEDKTLVLVEESMEGFLARLLKSSFNKLLEKGMINWLDALKNECNQ